MPAALGCLPTCRPEPMHHAMSFCQSTSCPRRSCLARCDAPVNRQQMAGAASAAANLAHALQVVVKGLIVLDERLKVIWVLPHVCNGAGAVRAGQQQEQDSGWGQ